MRRIIMGFVCTGLLIGGGAVMAQERTDTVTTAEAEDVTRGLIQDEVVGIKPLVGVLAFKDQTADNTARGAVGLEIDWNAAPLFGENVMRDMFFGPTVGFVYSHLGPAGSDFFGGAPDQGGVGAGGSNMFVIPTNLKVGYNVGENFRVSAHGGGNIIYRSVANTINLGDDSNTSDTLWKYYPNIGADLEFGLGRNAALSLRPDWTIAPNNDLFMGTLALVIGMG